MKPALALHRSIIFWAGLLVIIFTCWAWWDSCRNASSARWQHISANSNLHGVLIARRPRSSTAFQALRHPVDTVPDTWRYAFLPPFFVSPKAKDGAKLTPDLPMKSSAQIMMNHSPPGSWALYLPYWLILPPLILTWLTLLLFRARRFKRSAPSVSNPISSSTPIGDWRIGD